MNTAHVNTIKMFGPSISDPTKIVNRDVPACDEQAYRAAGYKRGSVPEVAEPVEPQIVKALSFGSEGLSMDEPDPVVETQPDAEKPAKARRKKSQN